MFKQFSRICLITTLSTVAIATPLGAQVSNSNRPPIPSIDQQTVVTGNGNTVQQNVNLYYLNQRGQSFPYSSPPSPNNLQQSVSPSLIRTPANLPNTYPRNPQNFVRH